MKGAPPKPRGLGAYGLKLWERLTLEWADVLTHADGLALELLCHSYQDYQKARRYGDKPATEQAVKRMRGLLVEFGATPAARGKVKDRKPASAQTDALQAFLEEPDGEGDDAN